MLMNRLADLRSNGSSPTTTSPNALLYSRSRVCDLL